MPREVVQLCVSAPLINNQHGHGCRNDRVILTSSSVSKDLCAREGALQRVAQTDGKRQAGRVRRASCLQSGFCLAEYAVVLSLPWCLSIYAPNISLQADVFLKLLLRDLSLARKEHR